jgi:hypothetical protein
VLAQYCSQWLEIKQEYDQATLPLLCFMCLTVLQRALPCAALCCVMQALVAYFFGKELKDSGTGLVAAALMAVVPGGWLGGSGGGGFQYLVLSGLLLVLVGPEMSLGRGRSTGDAVVPGVWGVGFFVSASGGGGRLAQATGGVQQKGRIGQHQLCVTVVFLFRMICSRCLQYWLFIINTTAVRDPSQR